MLGAIAGDIIGSVYEHHNVKTEIFELFWSSLSRFTDDTALTCAVADSILSGVPYTEKLIEYHNLYPGRGYGGSFRDWAKQGGGPAYNSYGNGSAMRVSPVAYISEDLETVLVEAKKSAESTHNHPEGIKGAQAAASAAFMARTGKSKSQIKEYIEKQFEYNLDFDLDDLRKNYTFDVTCQGSVPQAIYCFLISSSFEDAIRKAISIGGDSDTIACITGSIAEPYYGGVPENIKTEVIKRLDDRLRMVVDEFAKKYIS